MLLFVTCISLASSSLTTIEDVFFTHAAAISVLYIYVMCVVLCAFGHFPCLHALDTSVLACPHLTTGSSLEMEEHPFSRRMKVQTE